MGGAARTFWLGVALHHGVACRAGLFHCKDNTDCADGRAGICQSDGHCSFADANCPSGQRYAAHSGSVSGMCVPPEAAGSDDSSGPAETTLLPGEATAADDSTSASPGSSSGSSSGTATSANSTSTATDTGGEPLDPDLLLWFEFDEIGPSGVANTGVLGNAAMCEGTGCPTPTAGPSDAAAHFDGSDDCAVFVDETVLAGVVEISIAAWIRVAAYPTGVQVVLGQPVGTGFYNAIDLAIEGDGTSAQLLLEGIVDQQTGAAAVVSVDLGPLDVWTHVVATYRADSIAIWVNGVMAADAAGFELMSDGQPLLLGCDDNHEDALTYFFAGDLDDVRLYRRVLTASEIATLYGG